MQFRSAIAALAMAVGLASAQTSPPSSDPFYVQPANIASFGLGEVVKNRSISTTILGLTAIDTFKVAGAFQYMFRSNDSLGNPVGDVMTYLVPQNADNGKLLAYSIMYDSHNTSCQPSYTLRPNQSETAGVDTLLIRAALANGWHVVTSDYEGLKAEFVAGIQSGHAVLDSIKASLSAKVRADTKLNANAQYAMFGYSGGSLANEWAAEMAPTYAPQLTNFLGVAIGGLVPNITNVLLTISGTFASGLAFPGVLGMTTAYQNLSDFVNTQYIPEKKAQFMAIGNSCGNTNQLGMNMDLFSYFKSGKGILQNNVYKTVLSGGGQQGVHGNPQMPMYIYKAVMDEVSPGSDTDELVNKYCAANVTIRYERNLIGGHITEFLTGAPGAFQWLMDRFAGRPLNQQLPCDITTDEIHNTTEGGSLTVFGQQLGNLVENHFQTNMSNETQWFAAH